MGRDHGAQKVEKSTTYYVYCEKGKMVTEGLQISGTGTVTEQAKIVTDPRVLSTISEDTTIDEGFLIVEKLIEAVRGRPALGLSAIQIGIPKRVFIMLDGRSWIGCINPGVISMRDGSGFEKEACLSIPGYSALVPRPYKITVDYNADNHRLRVVRRLHGLAARIFLHELDHLNGITIMDKNKNKTYGEA